MEKLAIIGAGTMGHSIALAAAWAGLQVNVYGVNGTDVESADKGLVNKLKVMEKNGLFSDTESEQIRGNISFSIILEEVVKEATFIIEAIPEILDQKKELYSLLENIVDQDTVIASNTSGFRPTLLAEEMKHPNRLVVTHFWNPAHLIPLVEVVGGERTDEQTIKRAMEITRQMKKKPILLKKEIPGFIGNRLQYALFREAQALLDTGAATKEDIDAAVTYSIGRRLPVTGPLMTADMGGLDVFSAISNYLFADLSNVERSGETLSRLVDDRKLGDKSGEGFYLWDQEESERLNAEREQTLIHFLKKDLELEGEEEQ